MFKRLRKRYEIKVLRLQPGDIVILRTDMDLDEDESASIRESFAARTGITPVVLSGGIEISALGGIRASLLQQKRTQVNLGLS